MTDWSADPWFAEHAWVAPRVGETRRSGFKSLRPHAFSVTGPAGQRQSFRLRGGPVPLPDSAGRTEALSTYSSESIERVGFARSSLHRMDHTPGPHLGPAQPGTVLGG